MLARIYVLLSSLAIAGFVGAFPAVADMLVIESNVPAIPVGAVFPDGAKPQLPDGGSIQLLHRPANRTERIWKPAMTNRLYGGAAVRPGN